MEKYKRIIFFGDSDKGLLRTNNEDAFILERLNEHSVLAVAIDGVGGYEGGEVAASIAKERIPSFLKEHTQGERLSLLEGAVTCANNAIFAQRQKDDHRSNMSCVLTSVLIDTEQKVINMVHVGDTRLYQYYRGGLEKLSHDHSYIGYSEEIGIFTEEQAMHHPRRNEVSRVVGNEHHEVYDPDFFEAEKFPLLPNSILLLCSDGLTDMITRAQIISIIEQNITLEEKTKALINAANEAGGKDNITVVLVEYQAEEETVSINETTSPIANDENNNAEGKNNEDFLPTNDKKEETSRKSLTIPLLLGSIVLLVGACIALTVFLINKEHQMRTRDYQICNLSNQVLDQDVQIHRLKKQLASLGDAPDTMESDSPNPVQTIGLYIKAIQENDFETISDVFAPHVRRYINAFDKSNQEVVNIHKKYDNRFGVTGKHVTIRMETWESTLLPDGELSVDFIEDYRIDRIDTTLKSQYVLYYHVQLDPDGKIVSIYYDELPDGTPHL